MLAESSIDDHRILRALQGKPEILEVSALPPLDGGQARVVEVRHHCRAGGGCEEEGLGCGHGNT